MNLLLHAFQEYRRMRREARFISRALRIYHQLDGRRPTSHYLRYSRWM